MTYPNEFEELVGFDRIKQQLRSACMGAAAKQMVDDIAFSTDYDYIDNELHTVDEMKDIVLLVANYPTASYPDIDLSLARLKVGGSVLQLNDFVGIKAVLENARMLRTFFRSDDKDRYPRLRRIMAAMEFPTYVNDRIEAVVGKNGEIRDGASPQLREIRNSIADKHTTISKRLNAILGDIKSAGWISKELSATMVNGRLALPIESTHKRKIQGIVVDESASGKTSYIEPQEVVGLNNDLRELELAEKREIQKILATLTDDLRPYGESLATTAGVVARMDFVHAKARLAADMSCIMPQLQPLAGLELVRGIHPLLQQSLQKEHKTMVPLTLTLSANNRIVVISGPNAGGKSVSLKTTALLTYMLQCGLQVPVGGTSVFGIFKNIFIDIGDKQSIENELSTYSSHLLDMKYFLRHADTETLILIDEFGSGTEPVIGGAIAEAVLSALNDSGTFGIVTTHYSNLKVFASTTAGVQNAAMSVNSSDMTPTFVLEQGLPGSSYALEIARRIGLPQDIIDTAMKNNGRRQDMDKFLRRIIRDKNYWERKRLAIRQQEKKKAEVVDEHLAELEALRAKRRHILDEARKEAETLLADVNRQIESTIKRIRESAADKEVVKAARHEMEAFKDDFRKSAAAVDDLDRRYERLQQQREAKNRGQKPIEMVHIDESKINIGSKVRVKGQNALGEVIDIGEKAAVVSFGDMYSCIDFGKLEKVSENDYQQRNRSESGRSLCYNEKLLNFKPYIDIRGLHIEEAQPRLTALLDEAVMLNFHELRILHGKGNGILRRLVRDFLHSYPHVEACYDEDIRFGGSGITIVKLK